MRRSLVLTLLLILTGCSKEIPPDVINYRVSDALKAYFNWKTGSYWIFKDSLNNIMDSFRLTLIYDGISSPGYDNVSTEEIALQMHEYFHPLTDSNRYWELDLIASRSRLDATDLQTPYFFTGNIGYIYSNFTNGIPFSLQSNDPSLQKSLLSSVSVNGKTYTNVYRYFVTYDSTHTDEILLNADSGFIKMSFGKYAQQNLLLEKANIVH
jgi:hypothetical protein